MDLTGRLTIGPSNDKLNEALRQLVEQGVRKILVNFTNVSQIDSSGISTLVRTYVTLGRQDAALKLLGVQGRVREVFSITRLIGTIPTFDDEPAALASFR